MEEVQSWWEVPAVAHFCYVFRSAFNLIFFEIAELESALLNIQDPDMSISLDQLIVRLLQGCYDDDESVSEQNWEEKLHELFNENCEDDENIFNDNQYFMHLTPRSKIEILHRLCEFRLDVDGALEAIKNIPSEDMQAKCMGKDSQNNTYWYFCDERMYKENPNAMKLNQTQKKKEGKNTPNKSSKQVNTREKRTKGKPDIDKAWSIICHNISDWEKLMKTFTKSKSTHEKELATAIKKHLPILQERVAEKDRLLRKRFMEIAPKRTSSRISKVQEMKKIEEMKAQEEARRAQLKAEKERARLEAKRLKEEKESRQKRAEMRRKAIEERAKRAQLRERVRGTSEDSEDDSEYDDEDSSNDNYSEQNHKNDVIRQRRKVVNGNIPRNIKNGLKKIEESEEDDDENEEDEHNSDRNYKASSRRANNRSEKTKHNYKKTVESTNIYSKRYQNTYSRSRKQQDNGQLRVSSRLQNISKTVKSESDESEQESDEAPSNKGENGIQTRLQQNSTNEMDQSNSEESADENGSDDDDSRSDKIESQDSCRRIPIQKTFTVTKSSLAANESSKSQDMRNPNIPKVTLYKSNFINSSGTSNWTFDSKERKLHILSSTFDNLSPKRLKLDERRSTASSTLKSPLSKENHVYKTVQRTPTPFITFGRIIPTTKPAIVRLDFRKPPNPPVSS